MDKEKLNELRKAVFSLSDEEKIARDLYLKQFYDGTLSGPLINDVYISRPGVAKLREMPIVHVDVDANPFSILENLVEKGSGDKKIIYSMDGKSMTYHQLYDEALGIALRLQREGLKKGDTIACLFLNSIDEAPVLFAALSLGIKVKYVDFSKGLSAIKKYISETQIAAIFMDKIFAKAIPFIYRKDMPIVVTDTEKDFSFFNISTVTAFSKKREGHLDVQREDAGQNPAILITSSGTTGKPKPIIHTNHSINCGVRKVLYENFELGENSMIAKVIPSHIAMGVVGILCTAIYSETPVIMVQGNSAAECANNTIKLVKSFKLFKVQHGIPEKVKLTLFSSPIFLKTIADNADSFEDLSCLGTLLSAGSKLSGDNVEYICSKIRPKGCVSVPVNVYGQNEMHLQTANNDRGNKIGSVGAPTIGTYIVIVDDGNVILGPNTEGRILEQSDTTFKEYEGLDEKTRAAFITMEDGTVWFDTQDKGFIDKDGYVFVTGRFSRSMVRFDCKISLETIEEKIKSHTDVKDCVMIALEQENEEDSVPVLYIDTGSKKVTFEKILKDLGKKGITLNEYEMPLHTEFIKIPYLQSQKPDIQKLTKNAEKYLKH